MAIETWHDLGPVAGACTVCGADGRLSLGECRVRRSAVERLRRLPVPQAARLVTCSSCAWRWTVRTDMQVAAADEVVHSAPEPGPVEHTPASPRSRPGRHAATPSRTVLPAQRDRRRLIARLP